jgi:hypothetical protein
MLLDELGASLSMSGRTLAVGASNVTVRTQTMQGAVYVFELAK